MNMKNVKFFIVFALGVFTFYSFARLSFAWTKKPVAPQTESVFDKSCYVEEFPLKITSKVVKTYYNSQITITICNKSSTTVSAVKFLVVCKNAYGEMISHEKYIYDNNIAETPAEIRKLIVDKQTRFVEIHVYSVYYYKNCKKEWGIRKIGDKDIIENVPIHSSCEIE